ncbi:MAG: hypothetical protein ACYTEL_08670 [Planctomycetota bacterium]|jgi:DNA-directed RNA polymerase
MMRTVVVVSVLGLLAVGCESLRFGPSEAQKQNAWVHNRTTAVAAETAKDESASQELQALTKLSELQSRAFVSYHGLPKEFPKADTAEDILAETNLELARGALADSSDRPDAWQVADSMLDLGIGIAALFGGVCGTRVVRCLREARTKSKALKEIIEGNELFKRANREQAEAFKEAQKRQSSGTRRIVAQLKG